MTFPVLLLGSVWHTTNLSRFESIVTDGYIYPEPNLNDSDRWGTAQGPNSYPFVRSLGGVSLFDFRDFDAESYSQSHPNSSVYTFVPCRREWGESIWIKLNISILKESFIGGNDLVEQWKSTNQLHRKIMPRIEAAHIGPVPIETFVEIYKYTMEDGNFMEVKWP